MKTIIKIPTWTCACGYHQDFEPTQELMDLHFNNDKQFVLNNVKANQCPSCALKGIVSQMVKETNSDKKTTIIIMGEEELDTLEIEENKIKRLLTPSEKSVMRAKIQADIIKFTVLEDK